MFEELDEMFWGGEPKDPPLNLGEEPPEMQLAFWDEDSESFVSPEAWRWKNTDKQLDALRKASGKQPMPDWSRKRDLEKYLESLEKKEIFTDGD